MSEQAPVSVIIPCYRCTDTIDRALMSIAAQTMLPAEIILVDDCSGDGTVAALYRVQANYPRGWIQIISLPKNAGPGTARNIGWAAATQPYIAFLDSDDSWHPQKIEFQYGWMQLHPDVVLTGHDCQQVNEGKDFLEKTYSPIIDLNFYAVSKKQLLLTNHFPTRSVILRRDIQQRFQNGKRYCEDYHLWVDICCAGLLCYRSDLPLAYLYKAPYGEAGLSSALWKMEKGKLDVYRSLFYSGLIKWGVLVSLVGWSLFKFTRRVVIVTLAKVRF